MQSQDIDLLAAINLIENAKLKIKQLNYREMYSFSKIVAKAEDFMKTTNVELTALSVPRHRRVPKKIWRVE